MKVTEICEGVFKVVQKSRLGLVLPPVNIYVFACNDGLVFDAGYGTGKAVNSLLGGFEKIGKIMEHRNKPCRITRGLPSHSHPDHFSGLVPLQKIFGIKILLTPAMKNNLSSEDGYHRLNLDPKAPPVNWRQQAIRFTHKYAFGAEYIQEPDEIVDEGSDIDINGRLWRILQSPGHCDDHISLYHEEKGVLMAGDNVLQSITTWLGPPRSDIKVYCQTLRMYLDLPKLDIIHAAHGRPVLNPKDRIRELLLHRDERTHEVLNIIRKAGRKGVSIREIVGLVYTGKEVFKRPIAGGWVQLTVENLLSDNLIRKRVSGLKISYISS